MSKIGSCSLSMLVVISFFSPAFGRDPHTFEKQVAPFLRDYCQQCHNSQIAEAEIDLSAFSTLESVRREQRTWRRISEVLITGDMPPPDAIQPSDDQREQIAGWIKKIQTDAARDQAGDPGPVGLRRLDNAEYTYVLRDITGIDSLDPAREFPVDGAAGEGFTNVASGQAMSSAMIQKYLDAAKNVAEHLVLTPDGLRFSQAATRRDQTDEMLARIQAFYSRFTDEGGGTPVDLHGIEFESNQGGRLPIERYLRALLESREEIHSQKISLEQVAFHYNLSPRYLTRLWQTLESFEPSGSALEIGTLLQLFRQQWRHSGSDDSELITKFITDSHERLWKFNPVGQVGREGGSARWMELVIPTAQSVPIDFPLVAVDPAGDWECWITAIDPTSGHGEGWVICEQPRLVFTNTEGISEQPDILLRDVAYLIEQIEFLIESELSRSVRYLAGLEQANGQGESLDTIAKQMQLDPDLLRRWSLLTGIGSNQPVVSSAELENTGQASKEPDQDVIPADSSLAQWRSQVLSGQAGGSAASLVASVISGTAEQLPEPDRLLQQMLLDWRGVLGWVDIAQARLAERKASGESLQPVRPSQYGLPPSDFGVCRSEHKPHPADLVMQATASLPIRLPAKLASGAHLVTTAKLYPNNDGHQSAQVWVAAEKPAAMDLQIDLPVLVLSGSSAEQHWGDSYQEFAELFPPAVCYYRIVPVDEVVTLVLYYREDELLRKLLLNDAQLDELEKLWDELYFISREPLELVVSLEQLIQFATQDREDLVPPLQAMQASVNKRADSFRQSLLAAEPLHLEALVKYAARFWRRPLNEGERHQLRELYGSLRSLEVPHEEALKLTLARILTSANFLYKIENVSAGTSTAPVLSRELANRLSFFLWSSVPDEQLLSITDAGLLEDIQVLRHRAQRMLKDPRARRLAVHFACQWLHLRDFSSSNDKNENLFPEFADLRQPMLEEVILFFEDIIRNDRSILDILAADHTFVNSALAEHYGINWANRSLLSVSNGDEKIGTDDWYQITDVQQIGRGGILGMAAVLASQSGASRTSPILRGNWVFETLLGQKLPKPPPGVPQLPEQAPEGLTERQLFEQHSSVEGCARCHIKIDPYGFALEQFDTIGRRRPQVVDSKTTLASGQNIQGLEGLRDYLTGPRRQDFINQFCRKLLGYALGRELQLTDEPLLEEMSRELETSNYQFSAAVLTVVASPQFRNIRSLQFAGEQH